MRATPTSFYEFGPYRLDPTLPLLLRGGVPVHLPPKHWKHSSRSLREAGRWSAVKS
jgi:hypothetical protein